ncbi:acyltransferase [Lysobacter sp. S4-A87]|nr:acyltransferase [Lysobacter sp. S4-A87]
MRAIAVVAVVLYHAGIEGLAGGFVGVDIFFVISGYLITALLLREHERGSISLVQFYARRARRILPVLWLVTASTVAAAMVLLSVQEKADVLDSGMASLAFIANFHFLYNSGGYFGLPADGLPLLHLWSLAVEEQFYLVWPLLMIACLRWSPRRLASMTILCIGASLLVAEFWLASDPERAFYLMPARFWELAVGCLIATRPTATLRGRVPSLLATSGLTVMVASLFMSPVPHFPGLGALPAVAGAALLILALHDSTDIGRAGALLRSRAMVFFGLISYSLYLWHWPLLAFDSLLSVQDSSLVVRLGLCGVATTLAWASYRFVEGPVRKGPFHGVRAIGGSAAISAALIVLAFGLKYQLPAATADPAVVASTDYPTNIANCHFGFGMEIRQLPAKPCYSDPGKPPQVVIWGDSHALAWQPFAWELANRLGVSAVGFTLDSCPPVDGYSHVDGRFPTQFKQCRRLNELVLEHVAGRQLDTIIMNGRWVSYFPEVPDDRFSRAESVAIADGLERSVQVASRHARRVLIFLPSPQIRDNSAKCISLHRLEACAASREEFDRSSARARALLKGLAARYQNVTLVDPADFLCDGGTCPVMKDGYALYWDSHHVSSTAARAFARAYLDSPMLPASILRP